MSKSGNIRKAIGPINKRLKDYVTEYSEIIEMSIPSDPTEKETFINKIEMSSAKLTGCVDRLSELDDKWSELMLKLTEVEREPEEAIYEQTAVDGYLNNLQEGKELLQLLACKQKQCSQVIQSKESPKTDNRSSNRPTFAKLPKLELPVFSGDAMDWQHFWTIFEASVGSTGLTGVEKFSYLKSRLRDTALEAIGGLPITAEAYIVAVDILKERFQRAPEELVSSLYSQLKRMAPSSDRVKDLRKTYDSCEKILRQLRDANEDVDNNRSLVLDICSKYPEQIITNLTRHQSLSNKSTLAEVQTAIKQYIEQTDGLSDMLYNLQPFHRDRESSKPNRGSQSNQRPYYNSNSASSGKPNYSSSGWSNQSSNTTALTVAADQQNPQYFNTTPKSPCYFCGGDHFNSHCEAYPTAEDRRKRLIAINRCERCLDSTHVVRDCRTRPTRLRCHFCKTTGVHGSPLCPVKFSGKPQECGMAAAVNSATNNRSKQPDPPHRTGASKGTESKGASKTESNMCALGVEEQAILATAVAIIRNSETGFEQEVRIIMDNGCPRSFVLDTVAREMNLPSESCDKLFISAFGCKRVATHPSRQVQFQLQLRDGSNMLIDANTVSMIVNRSAQPDSLPYSTERLTTSLANDMADNRRNIGPPEVLIGSDYFWQIISCNRIVSEDGICLVSSGLGYLLGGKYRSEERCSFPSLLCLPGRTTIEDDESVQSVITGPNKVNQTYPDIDEYWELEKIGITDDPVENDDEVAQDQFKRTVRFENGRYAVCWPWKPDTQHRLPTNYALAVGRLRSLAKRIHKADGKLQQAYDKTITEQLEKGIIEKVPRDEQFNTTNPVHYLPHHAVVREGASTTKVRIVYDASAKTRREEMSLNECLFRGPVILPDLCSILIRFRLHKVALISDIEKAFLQLALQSSERDVTRFLWFRDPDNMNTENNVECYRFARVPFGVISSPFLLGATIQHHVDQSSSPVAPKIRNNIYVDNVISGVDSEDEAFGFYVEAKRLFSEANMNLREWTSNSKAVRQQIAKGDLDSKPITKVLGIEWLIDSDEMRLHDPNLGVNSCQTKREVLKAIASIYDPLGLYQPCTLVAKSFLRELWEQELGWDQPLESSHREKWAGICNDVSHLFKLKLPRLITCPPDRMGISLIVFSDASKVAYAAAVYLRVPHPNEVGRFNTTLVYSKSRLTPRSKSKSVSLPRLELLGLTIAARIAQFVRTSISQSVNMPCHVFCDSTCVLGWLKTNKPLQRFVGNRISEIRKLENAEFHYVQTDENPADLCTRGVDGSQIQADSLWWNGPTWLHSERSSWPKHTGLEPFMDDDFLKEIASSNLSSVSLLVAGGSLAEYPLGIDPTRFSSCGKLMRVTILCLKFLKKLTSITTTTTISDDGVLASVSIDNQLSGTDVALSKRLWIKSVQRRHLGDIFKSIKSNKRHQLVNQLNLLVEDDVLRCGGRLANAELPYESRCPILLPKRDAFCELIVKEAHVKLFHAGVNHTLSQLRREYWIPQGRNVVRRVISKCVICRRYKGKSFALPRMPDLPRERVSRSRPFQFTGVDYLGPVNVKAPGNTTQKMWCCLFTCLAVRAIHLECVTDCTAQTFIECLSRFVSRRGCPDQIISDNGPQFRLAQTVLDRSWQKVLTDSSVCNYLAEKNIKWQFITELAPWQGGVYERLVGVVKSTFKSVIGRRFLRWDEFITLVVETEAIVNSRPITYVHSDIDSGTPLRPMDFIVDLPTGTAQVDPAIRPEGGDATKNLLRMWRAKQNRLNAIWKQWYQEYLSSMRERYQTHHKGSRGSHRTVPEEGEVVIVRNDDAPRGQWKLARITKLIPSRDGTVRSAELVLPNKIVIRRALNMLFPLEVPSSGETPDPEPAIEAAIEMPINDANRESDDEFEGFEQQEVDVAERLFRANIINNNPSAPIINGTVLVAGRQMIADSLACQSNN